MKKVFLSVLIVLFIGISSSYAQKVVFKLETKKACTSFKTSYKFKVYVDGDYDRVIYMSLGEGGSWGGEKNVWYKECAGNIGCHKIDNSEGVSIDKAVELLWKNLLEKSASSVIIDWND